MRLKFMEQRVINVVEARSGASAEISETTITSELLQEDILPVWIRRNKSRFATIALQTAES